MTGNRIYRKKKIMNSKYIELIKKHISTHTEQSAEDRSAVSYLESVLSPDGRINTSFASDDKWPNHDGMFEYVPNPDVSRHPVQNFVVQIKGTNNYTENNGIISYCLKSLAFPAYIAYEVTADPGIIFIVLNPDIRGEKRIFWKYMSPSFIKTINFEKTSATIKLQAEDEIKDTDESIESFCKKLDQVVDMHLFFKKLDKLKKIALKSLFVSSQIMLIYGAAGTGKTTLINYISQMMIQSKKLFLSKTHTALQNLRRRVDDGSGNMQFSSIDRVIKSNEIINYDIVFVDECSTIDNRTIKTLLEKMNEDTKLVLCGDIYQIESIDFGNWFYYAKNIIDSKGANIELLHTWRTDKEELSGLWEEVREKRTIITEKLSMDGPFSENLGKSIFTLVDDEVILCLNYDGKFGLNSMNQYFQNANTKSEAFTWAEWIFKIGDRIIFLDTRRSSLLYNNLKGVIEDIIKTMSSIVFTININTYLTEEQCRYETFEYIENTDYGTRIRLEVIAWDDDLAEEDRIKTVVPFQIAYAISIHKAQGLEYNSVKVVVPSSNAEKITHSIFYTAITRAKEKLKIYWSAETMDAIVKSFKEPKIEYKSIQLIKEKLVLEDEC